jgi:Kef-type K+ transport system membrane component KefB
VRGTNGEVLLTYRAFATIVGVIAAFLAGVVAVAGIAAILLLLSDDAYVRAAIALALTVVFSFIIALLTPRTNVTLSEEQQPALTIAQRAIFPSAVYTISTPNGARLAELRKSFLSRLGRNRWRILHDGRLLGEAREVSFVGAMLRKLFGKFSRSFETDLQITTGGIEVGRILRRPDASGRADILVVTNDALDRRVLVALATLVLGREP